MIRFYNVHRGDYDFGFAARDPNADGEALTTSADLADLQLNVGTTARYFAIADRSDVRGVLIRRTGDTDWHELVEGRPILLAMENKQAVDLARLDRTSGELVLLIGTDDCDLEQLLGPVRNYASMEINSADETDSRDYALHMPRSRTGLMRYELRIRDADADTYTLKARVLRQEAAGDGVQADHTRRAGNRDSNLDNDSIATAALGAGTATTVTGFISGAYDYVVLNLNGTGATTARLTLAPA